MILLLYSGGLDSLLAARLLTEAGADVQAVHFVTPYAGSNQKLAGEEYLGKWGVPIGRISINVSEFRPLLENPSHGFGRALNPCIDCKIMFLKKAREILEDKGFSAAATGSVVGERPMSQNLKSLYEIEKESGLEGLLLRPLSALLLPETEVERNGLIEREKLLGIKGRSRKPQLELARKWGITGYATPSGGCLLTEPIYARKLRDLMEHGEDTDETVALLKQGRHFRFGKGPKLIVGRNKEENEELLRHQGAGRTFLEVKGVGSPIGLLFSAPEDQKALSRAASIVSRYSDAGSSESVEVTWRGSDRQGKESVRPLNQSSLEHWRV